MAFELNAEQQAFVDEANRRAAEAAKSGRAPSQYFIDKCNSEAGVDFSRVNVEYVKDAGPNHVQASSKGMALSPMALKQYRILSKSRTARKSASIVDTLVAAFSGIFTHR